MKRMGNLYEKIIHKQNILEAIKNARKNKTKRNAVKKVDVNLVETVNQIHDMLKHEKYKVAEYVIDEKIERGKSRVIYKLPYNPDRIIQHAIMQIIEPIIEKTYIKDTYQSIKARGVHKAKDRIKTFLKDKENTKYVLKIDIEKFYPNIDNHILKKLLRLKIKCKPTLKLLDTIIDSAKGIPIGNYISQMLGNFYLTYFDHYAKETLGIKYYIRYADDIVMFLHSKQKLHGILNKIKLYFKTKLKLKLKRNYQVFPFLARGLDFLGFRFFEDFTLIRKSIKKAYIKVINKIKKTNPKPSLVNSLMSYYGWIKHTNSHNLMIKTITKPIKDTVEKLTNYLKAKNPLSSISFCKRRKVMLKYYQPTLF